MFPRETEKAVWAGRALVLIPSTWVSLSSNFEYAARNEETWSVQPLVKECTCHDRTTFLSPLYWPSVTCFWFWSTSMKSGARSPISAIVILLFYVCSFQPSGLPISLSTIPLARSCQEGENSYI